MRVRPAQSLPNAPVRAYREAMTRVPAVSLAVLSLAVLPAAPVAARELPPKSITHQNSQFWSWAGPRNWTSADGAYGINIVSGDGRISLDYGFSSILCATAADLPGSVTAYFAGQRASLRQSLSTNWRKARMRASGIVQLPESAYGASYFRQIVRATGRSQGQPMRALVVYDYSLASGPTYCYSRSISKVVPAAGSRTSLRQLGSVQASLAYFGPGAQIGPIDVADG